MPPPSPRREPRLILLDREIWNRRSECARPDDGVVTDAEVFSQITGGVAASAGGVDGAEEFKARLCLSADSFLTAATRCASRNSAPGEVARTRGTPLVEVLCVAVALREGNCKLLTDRGLRRARWAADAGPPGDLFPPSPERTRWKTKSVKRRFV